MDIKLEELMERALIEYIVDRVIEKIIEKNKTAIVLFTGATIGFKQSIESLNKLQENGWKLKIVLSNGAKDVLTEDLIKTSLNVDKVITEDDVVDIKLLLDENTLVIIPSLTVNSASKIANCISDTLVTNIVSKALMSGKKIIASINACCIDNEERKSIYGNHLTEYHKQVLRSNLEKIKNYGIILTTSENLAHKVIDKKSKKIDRQNFNKRQEKIRKDETSIKINKNLISRSDIYENRKYKTIIVNKSALITDLARDEAKRFEIKIIKR